MTSTYKGEFELLLFDLAKPDLGALATKPTVCLLVADSLNPSLDLGGVLDGLVAAGCTFFMTWGKAADELHDALDGLILDRGGKYLQVVTASHKGEPAPDVAWFAAHAAIPKSAQLRVALGFLSEAQGAPLMLGALRRLHGGDATSLN